MSVRERYEGLQSLLQRMGEYACHFLVLCSIAEEHMQSPIDILTSVRAAIGSGLVRGEDIFVKDNCGLLKALTGKAWRQRIVADLPLDLNANEYTEVVYYNPRTRLTHFRRRGWDTLSFSVTVNEGHIKEYRIYECVS